MQLVSSCERKGLLKGSCNSQPWVYQPSSFTLRTPKKRQIKPSRAGYRSSTGLIHLPGNEAKYATYESGNEVALGVRPGNDAAKSYSPGKLAE
ncbi:hypothetical protein V6N13_034919 [Hibiscus sabdariffa]